MAGALTTALHVAAKHGRIILIIGLVTAFALPDLAKTLQPWLGEMVACLLFIAALRVGPKAAAGGLADFRKAVTVMLCYQLLAPVVIATVFLIFGVTGPLFVAVVLMSAAAALTGSANLTLLTGNDPAPSLRLLFVSTAALPLTVIPVFWLSPEFGSADLVFYAAGRLLMIIAIAGGLAFLVRHLLLPYPSDSTLRSIDGVSALTMAVVVIGLMAAVGPALRNQPISLLAMLVVAFAVNFGPQIITFFLLGQRFTQSERVSWSITAGNRNMALFLAALPAQVTDPILLFIGCYQVPMYLTPLVLDRLYRDQKSDIR